MKVINVAKLDDNIVGFKVDVTQSGLLSNICAFLNDFGYDIAYYNRNLKNPIHDIACTISPCKGEELLDHVYIHHANFLVAIQQDEHTNFKCLNWSELAVYDLVQDGDNVFKPVNSVDVYQLEAIDDKHLFNEIYNWAHNYGYTFSKFEFCDNYIEVTLDGTVLQVNNNSMLMINSDKSISVYDSKDELTNDDFIII